MTASTFSKLDNLKLFQRLFPGWGGVESGGGRYGEMNLMDKDLTWGAELTMHCIDDVLENLYLKPV